MFVTREGVEKAQDWEQTEVEIKAWGGTVCLRSPSCATYEMLMHHYSSFNALRDMGDEFESFKGMKRIKIWTLSLTICDEDGLLIFNDDAGRDILDYADNKVIDDLYEVALELCKMSEVQIEDEKKESRPIASNGSNVLSVSE